MARTRLLGVILAGCLTLSACTASGGLRDDAAEPAKPTTSTTVPPRSSTDDVPDTAISGRGDPRIDVRNYDLDIQVDQTTGSVRGTVAIRFRSTVAGPLRSFTLDLQGPVVSRASIDDRTAQVSVDRDEITIAPASPIPAGQTRTLKLTYAGQPRPTDLGPLGTIGWQQADDGAWFTMSEPDGTRSWVPMNDHPSDKATWRMTVRTAPGMTAVSTGRLQGPPVRSTSGNRFTWVTDHPVPSYLVLLAVGRFDLVNRAGPNGIAMTFAFPEKLPAADRAAFDDTERIISYFASLFGPYPFSQGGALVVESQLGVALENPTRPLFGTDAIAGDHVGALAHELAHQWFGDDVTIARWNDLWLNEGFATYADWLWRDHIGEQKLADSVRAATETGRMSGLSVLDPQAARSFDPIEYDRGALTLEALRRTVGDATFFRILRTWVATYGGGNATTSQFIRLASAEAGSNVAPLLRRWLTSTTVPQLPR